MSKTLKNRRKFLATVGPAGAVSMLVGSEGTRASVAAESKEQLAINGGTPVCKNLLSSWPYGPQFYGKAEKQELLKVLDSRYLFRWWGDKSKVLQFEQAYKHLGVKHDLSQAQHWRNLPQRCHAHCQDDTASVQIGANQLHAIMGARRFKSEDNNN